LVDLGGLVPSDHRARVMMSFVESPDLSSLYEAIKARQGEPGEHLDGPAGEANLDLGAGKMVGNAIKMPLDIDMVVDTDTAHAPFGEDIGLEGQGLECRPVELFEQLPARDAEPADWPLLVEPFEQFADRGSARL
jgi:hypothetical protein